jgi:hypothetical protein
VDPHTTKDAVDAMRAAGVTVRDSTVTEAAPAELRQ